MHEQDGGVDVAQAAVLLGITPEAVRKRVRRRSLPAHKVAGAWRIVLPAQDLSGENGQAGVLDAARPAGRTPGRTDEPGQVARGDALTERLAQLVMDKAWLLSEVERRDRDLERAATALEREQTAGAELRRLLGNQQQQLAGLLAAPMAVAVPTMAATPPEAAELPDSTVVEHELKGFGLKRKQRRKLLSRLSGLIRFRG